MAVGIHAEGFMGLAFETVAGTWVTPSVTFPIRSETLAYQQDTYWRRNIRGIADQNDPAVAGFSHIEGEIECELMESILPYFLHVSRNTIVKSGSTDFTYTCTPGHTATATPKPGLSLTVVRAGVVFGYTGCLVSQMEFSTDNGIPIMKFSVVGLDETVQTLPVYTNRAADIPFSATHYSIEVPTASQVFDVDTYTCTINDNAEPVHRLNNTTKARYIRFGQREANMELTRDFNGRTEYDAFKALTATSVSLVFTKSVTKKVTIKFANAQRETYDLDGLSDQGTLHQATVNFLANYDAATSKAYEIVVLCQEAIT